MKPLTRIFAAALLSSVLVLGAPACGEKKGEGGDQAAATKNDGPKTPSEPKGLVEEAVKAFKAGKMDELKPLMPTKADFQEAGKLAGAAMDDAHIDKIIANMESRAGDRFAKLLKRAAKKNVDWSKAEIVTIDSKDKKTGGLEEKRLTVAMKSGDVAFWLKLKTFKLGRGLVLQDAPRIRMTAPAN